MHCTAPRDLRPLYPTYHTPLFLSESLNRLYVSGEFAFVALGIAERSGLIERSLCKLLLTTVALSMAATPMLAEIGGYISNRIEQEKGAYVEHITISFTDAM